jgi:DNA-binding HxlR family transcriptional regulator
MRWDETSTQTCSIAKSTSIFGDRWTLLILRQILMRIGKFSDIQQALGITKHRLTDRLNRLIEDKVIYKHLYDKTYNRYEYRLTEKGTDLYQIFIAIGQWGDKWESDSDGPPIEYIHNDCGHVANPALCCTCCGEKLTASNISLGIGPGLEKKLERNELSDLDKKLYRQFFPDLDPSNLKKPRKQKKAK